jgi:predicted small lipoprotein YifL
VLRRLTVVLSVSALLITLAACGGDGGTSGPPSDGDARTTSGGEPIGSADEGIEGVEAFRVDSNAHTEENLTYDSAPPTGGEHFPVPATCGFYEKDPPPDELLVHDLEHGAVWIAYDPDLDDAQKSALSSLVAQQAKVTATPYNDLESPLVVTAWARQMRLDSVDDPRLVQFIEAYRNSGNAPEPNNACQGAGTPTVASPAA